MEAIGVRRLDHRGAMNEYRCYFLRQTTILFGTPSSIDTTEEFSAATDEGARLTVETLYQKRASHVLGYELWQGTRLVHRHPADALS